MTWWIVIGLLALLAIYLYFQNHWFQTTTYRLHLPKLSHEWRNKRMVFLSDIHIKDRTKETFLTSLVEQVKGMKPDLILLGGDIIHAESGDHALDQLDYFLQQLGEVAPILGILGNHELSHPQLSRIEIIFKRRHVRILENEEVLVTSTDLAQASSDDFESEQEENNADRAELSHHVSLSDEDLNSEDLQVITDKVNREFNSAKEDSDAGILIWGMSEKEQTFIIKKSPLSRIDIQERDKGYPIILLVHYPQFFDHYYNDDQRIPDLILAGHNHGGQIILPFIGGVYAPRQGFNPDYDYGVYTHRKYPQSRMIVGRGIGNSAFPIRFNNRPEIVLIDLQ